MSASALSVHSRLTIVKELELNPREHGRLPCGVGLRGFESPPHFSTNPPYLVLSELVSFGLWLQRQGYRNSTVQPNGKASKALAKRTDLLDPESVKKHLALAQLSEGRGSTAKRKSMNSSRHALKNSNQEPRQRVDRGSEHESRLTPWATSSIAPPPGRRRPQGEMTFTRVPALE